MRLLMRWLIMAIALAVAVKVIPGISIEGTNAWLAVVGMALVLGLVNAVLRPILRLLSCPLVLLTLGLFLLVINGLTFWFASIVARALGIGFFVHDIGAAILGGIVVGVVSFLLSLILPDRKRH
jgi:putative membrane protein